MEKTLNVNVGGYAFIMEENAYVSLSTYIKAICKCYESNPNAEEIEYDIESRIGELLNEVKGRSEVVNEVMVDIVMGKIGTPETLGGEEESMKEGTAGKRLSDSRKKKLYRDRGRAKIGGVCAGLAAFFNIEVVWIRLAACLLFFGGLLTNRWWIFENGKLGLYTFLAYCICWLCIPEARTAEQKCEMYGKKVDLDRYRDFTPGKHDESAGGGKPLLGRLIAIFIGLLLLTGGCGALTGGSATMFGRHNINSNISILTEGTGNVLNGRFADDLSNLMCESAFWNLLSVHLIILGITLCYGATVLILDIKPRTRFNPGLILMLLWILSIIALAVWCGTATIMKL